MLSELGIQIKQIKKNNIGFCTIPVAFHVLHSNGIENISNAQICDAVKMLNENFRKRNSDTIYTVSNFLSLVTNSFIEFRFATKDPLGNSTNGINRIVTPLTYAVNDSSKINQCPPSKYLNIWVVDSLDIIGGINGVQGCAFGHVFANTQPNLDDVLL